MLAALCATLSSPVFTGEMCPDSSPHQCCLCHSRSGSDVQTSALPPGLLPLWTLPQAGAARRGNVPLTFLSLSSCFISVSLAWAEEKNVEKCFYTDQTFIWVKFEPWFWWRLTSTAHFWSASENETDDRWLWSWRPENYLKVTAGQITWGLSNGHELTQFLLKELSIPLIKSHTGSFSTWVSSLDRHEKVEWVDLCIDSPNVTVTLEKVLCKSLWQVGEKGYKPRCTHNRK